MSRAEHERSQERREASGTEAEQVQQFGAVFYITIGISAAFVLAGVYFTEPFGGALATVVGWITSGLGWLYMLMTSFFLGFAVWLALSRYGKIRLGQSDDRPEFGRFAWFAMLFPASPENTVVTLPDVELFILLIRIAAAPSRDGQDVAGEGDLHVIRRDSRERDPDHEVSTPGDYVGGRDPGGRVGPPPVPVPGLGPTLPEPTSRIRFHSLMESTRP
jgi:hypothetical protein